MGNGNNNIEHFFIGTAIGTDTNTVEINIDPMDYVLTNKNPLHNTNEK